MLYPYVQHKPHFSVFLSSRRFQSLTGQEVFNLSAPNGAGPSTGSVSPADLDMLKQEILAEVRKEINKAKTDIIDGEEGKVNGIYSISHKYVVYSMVPL